MQRNTAQKLGLELLQINRLQSLSLHIEAYNRYRTLYQANLKKVEEANNAQLDDLIIRIKFNMLVCQIKGHGLPIDQAEESLLPFLESLPDEATKEKELLQRLLRNCQNDLIIADSNYFYAKNIHDLIELQNVESQKYFFNITRIDNHGIARLIEQAQAALKVAEEKYALNKHNDFHVLSVQALKRSVDNLASQFNQPSHQLLAPQAKKGEMAKNSTSPQKTFKRLEKKHEKNTSFAREGVREKRKKEITSSPVSSHPFKKRRQTMTPTLSSTPSQIKPATEKNAEERPQAIFCSSLQVVTTSRNTTSNPSVLVRFSLHTQSTSVMKNDECAFLSRVLYKIANSATRLAHLSPHNIRLKAAIFDLLDVAYLLNQNNVTKSGRESYYNNKVKCYESSPFFPEDFSDLDLKGKPLRILENKEKFNPQTPNVLYEEKLINFVRILKEANPDHYITNINALQNLLRKTDESALEQLNLIIRKVSQEERPSSCCAL